MAKRELYVIEFESANFCGAGEHCLAWGTSEKNAEEEFEKSGWGEDFYREQDEDAYYEAYGEVDAAEWATVTKVMKLAGSMHEEWYKLPSQKPFYQIVN